MLIFFRATEINIIFVIFSYYLLDFRYLSFSPESQIHFWLCPPLATRTHCCLVWWSGITCFSFPGRKLYHRIGLHLPLFSVLVKDPTLYRNRISKSSWEASYFTQFWCKDLVPVPKRKFNNVWPVVYNDCKTGFKVRRFIFCLRCAHWVT